MAKRLNPNSRIPMIPKPTLEKGAASNVGNEALFIDLTAETPVKNKKVSKPEQATTTNIKPTLEKGAASNVGNEALFIDLTAETPVKNKKVSKPEQATTTNIKPPVQPTFVPYDTYREMFYKFQYLYEQNMYLKEDLDKLKTLKQQYTEQIEVLQSKSDKQESNLKKKTDFLEELKTALCNLQDE